ncbi:hypothetical protein BM451_15470 [Dickeya dadantii]|nr:hypothetical protein BM451_15470 [Dickeya dadantii]
MFDTGTAHVVTGQRPGIIPVIRQVAEALALLLGPSLRFALLPRDKALMSLAIKGQRVALFNTQAGCPAT